MKIEKILMIGPFPDPISGVSLANYVSAEFLSNQTKFKVLKINTSFPYFRENLGIFSFRKLLFYLSLNLNLYKVFISDKVYLTPGQTFFGVVKYGCFIILASLLNKELIIHVHGNYLSKSYNTLKGIKKRLFAFLIRKFNKGIVLSKTLRQNLEPFLKAEQIYILPNFAQNYLLSDFEPEIKEIRIIFLSNLMKEKGIIQFLKALNYLEKKGVKFEARIAGAIDPQFKEELQKRITNVRSCSYLGVVKGKNKKKLLEWGNIFILPTFYEMEGQPISILEALATQNLIISTRHAGIPDIIEEKVNGFFVNKQDWKSIQDILMYLSENKEKIREITSFNKEYFLNNFSQSKFENRLLQILEE